MFINNNIPDNILKNLGSNSEDIFVTGSQLVLDKKINKFIKVENYSNASLTNFQPEWFSCLITSNHKITIGNEVFWDWEDHFVKI